MKRRASKFSGLGCSWSLAPLLRQNHSVRGSKFGAKQPKYSTHRGYLAVLICKRFTADATTR